MKIRLLLFLATLTSLTSFAQTWVSDSVTMGAGYANDVYYSFKNDSIKGEAGDDWHLAFEMRPQSQGNSNVSVIANHVKGAVTVYSLPFSASKFATLAPSDTMTKNGPLWNADSTWHMGAFNANAGGSPFDFGWGYYDMTSHHVSGDSLYLVYVGAQPYKMTIVHYHSHPTDSIYYSFHIAKFDGTDDYNVTIGRKFNNFEDKDFAYYNITTNTIVNREPASSNWDVVFTRYKEWVVAGPPPTPKSLYSVTGILSSLDVEVAEISGVNPDTVKVDTNSADYSDRMQEIGSDWKTFNMGTMTYDVDTTRTYFVKTYKSMEYYQVKFTAFDYMIGKTVFAKRKVANIPTSVATLEKTAITAHSLVPNPANNDADIMVDMNEAAPGSMLIITDMTGRVAQRTNIDLKKGLNGFRVNTSGFAAGTYIVTVANGGWMFTDKLVVQH